MSVDVAEAVRFVQANARVLERHRLAVLLEAAEPARVLESLRPYRNADGGFGHALEPDVRAPGSEPAAALHALDVLAEVGALDDPMVADCGRWIGAISDADGGVPFVLAASEPYPHAPWMVASSGGSHLTFALAAVLTGVPGPPEWLARGSAWCWAKLDSGEELGAHLVKFALAFLDAVPESARAVAGIEGLRRRLGGDGSIAVAGGTDSERLTPLDLSAQPGARSRALFTPAQIEADLDLLEARQEPDGGWAFDWLGWSPGQSTEWRGICTVRALRILAAHGRLAPTRLGCAS